jgi:hypothetical protein
MEDSEGLGTGLWKTINFWTHDVTSNVDNSLAIFVAAPDFNGLMITVEAFESERNTHTFDSKSVFRSDFARRPKHVSEQKARAVPRLNNFLENEDAFDVELRV